MVKRLGREYPDHHSKEIDQKVEPRAKKNNSFKLVYLYAFLIFIIGFCVIIYINQYVNISRLNFQLEQLEEKKDKLKSKNAHLKLKISRLESLSRIEEIAKKELNMEEPTTIKYVMLKNDNQNEKLSLDKKEDSIKENKLKIKDRLIALFNNLSEVQAGTLD